MTFFTCDVHFVRLNFCWAVSPEVTEEPEIPARFDIGLTNLLK